MSPIGGSDPMGGRRMGRRTAPMRSGQMRRVRRGGRSFRATALIAVVMLAAGAVGVAASRDGNEDTVPPSVRFAGADWGGRTIADFRKALERWADVHEKLSLCLLVEGDPKARRVWNPVRKKLGAQVDLDATIADVRRVGTDETAFQRLIAMFAARKPVDVAARWQLNDKTASRYLKRHVAPVVLRPERNARFLLSGSGWKVYRESAGRSLDVARSVVQIKERLGDFSERPVPMPMLVVQPTVTTRDFHGIDGELSAFRTTYGERGNREQNIILACNRINGTLLKPGGVFSYNRTVGPRDTDGGFRLAPVIVRGKLQPGMGGGVCQVSSTLYNAVLLANLKIVQRTHHAFPVHYLPAGRDATVAYDSIDFRFQNDTVYPMVVVVNAGGGEVSVRLYGKRRSGQTVQLQRTNMSTWEAGVEHVTDSSLPTGRVSTVDRGHDGHRVRVWRIVRQNGVVVRRELVSSDMYRAFPRVVAVGTGPARKRRLPATAVGPTAPPPSAPAPGA